MTALRLAQPSLVVLVGPAGSGKTTWASRWFAPHQVVSSDALRALVGEGEHDLRASTDAFAVLDDVIARRVRRRLTTVVDSLGTDRERQRRWCDAARARGLRCVAVVLDIPERQVRAWNRGRERAVASAVLSAQLRSHAAMRDLLVTEPSPFDEVHVLGTDALDRPVRLVAPDLVTAPAAARRQQEDSMALRFGLQISRFDGGPQPLRERLDAIAVTAEAAGFHSIWLMDHLRQIPQVGRPWEDLPDSWTTLAYLAARTSTVRLGTMVTGVTFRNVAHLAKIVATVDVLSGGRAVCGIGAAWWKEEHEAAGIAFPPAGERLDLLEDAVRALPMLWGPGGGRFDGHRLHLADTSSYPRPVQARVPILVGGGGERRTLAIAARWADAANVQGDLATVRRKVDVLRRHAVEAGRDPDAVRMTHLAPTLVGEDDADVDARLVARFGDDGRVATWRAELQAGTVEEQIGRFRALAEAGVGTAVVSLADLDAEAVARFAPVIDAFRDGRAHPTDELVPI